MRTALIAIALIMFMTLAAGCTTDQQVIAQANATHTELQPAVLEDAQLNSYIQSIGDRIIATAKKLDSQGLVQHDDADKSTWMFGANMKFHLVKSDQLNAFTTGGEHMYVYTPLLAMCTSESELAAVMAHEYGHVYAHHVTRGQNDQMKVMLASLAAGGAAGYAAGSGDSNARLESAGQGAGIAMAGGKFIGLGFTRKQEFQADQLGYLFYTYGGWDPRHFGDFFQAMIDAGYDTTPGLLSDHPTLKSRVEQAKAHVAAMKDPTAHITGPIANDQQFAAIKARAVSVAKAMPDTPKQGQAQQLLKAFPNCVSPIEGDAPKAGVPSPK